MSVQLVKSVLASASAFAALIALSPPSLAAASSKALAQVAQAGNEIVTVVDDHRSGSYRTRAEEDDPAGTYRGSPNWARDALSPKN